MPTMRRPTLQQGAVGATQKCQVSCAPTLQQGVVGTAQKCQSHTAPALFWCHSIIALCRILSAPMGRVNHQPQQCQLVSTLPNHLTGGHLKHAEMPPIMHPHLTTGGQIFYAEMPRSPRSHFIWCRVRLAEMPLYWRTNNQRPLQKRRNVRYASPRTKQGDPLWINVTKTQPLPRYI